MPGPRVQINHVSATPRQKDDDVHAETDEVLEVGTHGHCLVFGLDPGLIRLPLPRVHYRGVDVWRSRLWLMND